MRPNLQETADLITITGEILNGKLFFLCVVSCNVLIFGDYMFILLKW